MKRKSVDNENTPDSMGRKRPRSQGLAVSDQAEDSQILTPSNGRRARYSSNGQLSRRADKLIEEYLEEGSPDPENAEEYEDLEMEMETPSKQGRGWLNANGKRLETTDNTSTPRKHINGKASFSTPKSNVEVQVNGILLDLPDADRSARRKSARTIIERTFTDDVSEDEEDENLVRHIYELDEEENVVDDDNGDQNEIQDTESVSEAPLKKGRGLLNRSKNRKRSLTPPQNLLPHELYFFQNRGGGTKTSNNNLSSLKLLDYEEYFNLIRDYKDPHVEDIEFLHEFHSRSFNQWQFELSQDFNICIYGWGSKRKLLKSFAEHVYKSQTGHQSNKIVVVNGYVHDASIRDILNTLASAVSNHPPKLGFQVAEMVETLSTILEGDKKRHVTLVIHSIDGSPLRRSTTQTLLAHLASHPQIHLIASADHPSFSLLWDSSLRSTYNFVFHDCTTFQPYTAEVDVVNEVHELLGRSGRRVGGKEGVAFVLKSLNQNSRKLFQLLVAEQVAAMDESGGFGGGGDEGGDRDEIRGDQRHEMPSRRNEQGVEYRLLFQKAVEDFICGDEVTFRTLLKEFHDHQMIRSRKDAMGTEMLSVPFRKEELEMILEDLMT